MNARVFLYEDQVDQLVQAYQGGGRRGFTVAGQGVMFDNGEVFHVYTDQPRTHFSGRPCAAEITFVPGDGGDAASSGVPVAVTLRLVDGVPMARGFVWGPDGGGECPVEFVPVRAGLVARSRTLLPTDALAGASVAVVGLGSGGSTIAVQLAQAGVGRIVLVDRDRLEVGNVSRHACGVGDLGRRKTAAVRDLVIGKNPQVDVRTVDADVVLRRELVDGAVAGVDLMIAATDSDVSRFVLNQIALDLDVTSLFGRVLTRACGGEVLRVRPRRTACLACVYTTRFLASRPREYSDLDDARRDAPAYASDADLTATAQVGLASDIAPVANLMVKLALVELCRGTGDLASLEEDLTADFYVWANRREGVYRTWSPMGATFTTPSILRWYGATHPRLATCVVCGQAAAGAGHLDESIFAAG